MRVDRDLIRKIAKTQQGNIYAQKFLDSYQALTALLRRFPQLGYIPNRAQEHFHTSLARGRGCFWPNRVGKTVALVNEADAYSQGKRIWYDPDHPRYKIDVEIPNIGRLYVNDYKAWERDVEMEWRKWVPKGSYRFHRNTQGNVTKITRNNRSVIHIMSYEQSPAASEGGQIHWACFNEPCPKSHFTATLRGLVDTNGPWWMCMTLLENEPWIWDQIWEHADGDDIEVIEATIEDNLRESGGVLDRDAVESFAAFLSEDERAARLYGRPIFASGRVFKQFAKREPWVVEDDKLPSSWPRFCAIDPHDRKPIAVLWAAVDPATGTVHVYDELYDSSLRTVEDVAQTVAISEREHNGRPLMRWIDPSGTKPDRTSGSTVQAEFSKYGIVCAPWSRADKQTRIIRTRHWFHPRKTTKDDPSNGLPRVVVSKRCVRLIWELLHYIYDPRTGKPVKENDDLIDCLMAFANADITRFSALPVQVEIDNTVDWRKDDGPRPKDERNIYERVTGY